MLGPEHVLKAVRDHLQAGMAAKLTELGTRLGVDHPLGTLPGDPTTGQAVQTFSTSDRPTLATDEMPAVLVVGQRTQEAAPAEPEDGALVWHLTYRLRIYTFARGQEHEETSTYRHRLALAVRELLLGGQRYSDAVALAPASHLRESYSDVAVDPDDGRSIAGAYLEVDVRAVERLTVDALGEVGTTVVTGDATAADQPHPAL